MLPDNYSREYSFNILFIYLFFRFNILVVILLKQSVHDLQIWNGYFQTGLAVTVWI